MTSKITKPSSIRNLAYIAPEGAMAGVWVDKHDESKFFVAKTTKLAAWSDVKSRSDLTGPLSFEEAYAALQGFGKIGRPAMEAMDALWETQAEAEVVAAHAADEADQVTPKLYVTVAELFGADVEMPGVEGADLDEEFRDMVAKAAARTAERNAELVEQCRTEFVALTQREDANTEKRQAQAARKLKMIVACGA